MSFDHKANKEEERRRILDSGGDVHADRNGGPARIYSRTEEGPGLAVARTLGDLNGHNIGVSAEPEITYKLLDQEDRFICIGSDGIWDVMNSAEIVGFIFEKLENHNKEKVLELLVWECRNRWEVINLYKDRLHEEKNKPKDQSQTIVNNSPNKYSIDDITALIFFINIEKEPNLNENNKNDENEKNK